jgi:hypothetical protein
VEISNGFICMDIILVFPRVVFNSIAFPFYQVLELASEQPAVENFFHFVFLFPINEFRWWGWRSMPTRNWIFWGE